MVTQLLVMKCKEATSTNTKHGDHKVGPVIAQVVGWENPEPPTKQVLKLGNPTPNVTSM
jgi:hypothetical protein